MIIMMPPAMMIMMVTKYEKDNEYNKDGEQNEEYDYDYDEDTY